MGQSCRVRACIVQVAAAQFYRPRMLQGSARCPDQKLCIAGFAYGFSQVFLEVQDTLR